MSILSFLILTVFVNLVNCKIYDVSTALKVELEGAFPANKFDQSCVSSSCPNLNNSNVCSASGSSYDLNATISALSECMQGTVCGVKIEPRPIPFIQFSLGQLLPGIPLSGSCNSTPNCVYTNVIPRFNILSNESVAMSLPDLAFVGDITCQLTRTITSKLGILLPSLLPPVTVAFRYNFNYSSSVVISANSSDAASVVINNPQLRVTGVNFNGLKFPVLTGILDYMPVFKKLVSEYLGKMNFATFIGDFYKGLLQSAFQTARHSCNN